MYKHFNGNPVHVQTFQRKSCACTNISANKKRKPVQHFKQKPCGYKNFQPLKTETLISHIATFQRKPCTVY